MEKLALLLGITLEQLKTLSKDEIKQIAKSKKVNVQFEGSGSSRDAFEATGRLWIIVEQ